MVTQMKMVLTGSSQHMVQQYKQEYLQRMVTVEMVC
nr:hypothetical protein CoNPh37_CDS0109 [Staphylococcus phage S-CoN_Ph37]